MIITPLEGLNAGRALEIEAFTELKIGDIFDSRSRVMLVDPRRFVEPSFTITIDAEGGDLDGLRRMARRARRRSSRARVGRGRRLDPRGLPGFHDCGEEAGESEGIFAGVECTNPRGHAGDHEAWYRRRPTSGWDLIHFWPRAPRR